METEVGAKRYGFRKWLAQFGGVLWPRSQPAVTTPSGVTAFDLHNETNGLLLDEARYGCMGQIERRIERVGRTIVDGEIRVLGTEEEKGVVEQTWINLLRLGLLDELLALFDRAVFPFPEEMVRFLRYCRQQYDVCQARGEAIRRQHPDSDLFIMGCIVWGEEYIANFLRYNVRRC